MLDNPVFLKEVKTKMRSRQPQAVQWSVAAITGLFVLWGYYQALGYLSRDMSASAGRDGWYVGLVLQALLIWMLCPSLAANAITQEREQQTWDMLIFSLLSPAEILGGKLAARVLPMLGLIAAFLPFMLFCFARSDLAAIDFFATYLAFVVWVGFLTTVGLFMSWAFRKTASALAASYVVVFVLTIGTAIVHEIITMGRYTADSAVMWLNPFRVCAALMASEHDPNAGMVIAFSLFVFAGAAGFLFWRMLARFHDLAVE